MVKYVTLPTTFTYLPRMSVMPGYAWKTYITHFRDAIAKASPNEAHKALSEIETILKDFHGSSIEEFCIITQNVDGLHQRAGSSQVYELHGSVYKHLCSAKKHPQPNTDINCRDEEDIREKAYLFDLTRDIYPTCERDDCDSYLRPSATLYGECISIEEYTLAERVALDTKRGDLVFIVGASGKVEPAASMPFRSSKNTLIIEINPLESSLTSKVLSRTHGKSFSMGACEFFSTLLGGLKDCVALGESNKKDD